MQKPQTLPFPLVCDILDALTVDAQKYTNNYQLREKTKSHVDQWFDYVRMRSDIGRNADTLLAVLSTLLPECRPDRVFHLKEDGLARVVLRCQNLDPKHSSRASTLLEWHKKENGGELGIAVQKLLEKAENPATRSRVTVGEVSATLDLLAGACHFSSEALRRKFQARYGREGGQPERWEIVRDLYRRVTSREAKWLTCCILKRFPGDIVPEKSVLFAYHFMLPHIYAHQNDLEKACALIIKFQDENRISPRPENAKREKFLHSLDIQRWIKPEIGVQIDRPEFVKATSIDHIIRLANKRDMSMERKYDGEYVQIHIDLTKPRKEQIKIFSKHGRDSTWDREKIHGTIRTAFRFEHPDQKRYFEKYLILCAEMVVFNDREGKVMPIHALRSFVSRGGIYIGGDNDSPRDRDSHLMLSIFDILLMDEEFLIHSRFSARRARLRRILPKDEQLPGRCEVVESKILWFSRDPEKARQELTDEFVRGWAQKWEGFVLKPRGSPYTDLSYKRDKGSRGFGWVAGRNAWIKFKRDYIAGYGDSADFCIVGGRAERGTDARHGTAPASLDPDALRVFHAAAILNKEGIKHGKKPRLRVLFEVRYSIPKEDLAWIQSVNTFKGEDYRGQKEMAKYDLEYPRELSIIKLDRIFATPIVFEVVGDRFERQTNCGFWTIGKPKVGKIHWDRPFTEALGYDELQEIAEVAVRGPDLDSQEKLELRRRLEEGTAPEKPKTPAEPSTTVGNEFSREMPFVPPRRRRIRHALTLAPAPSSGFKLPDNPLTRRATTALAPTDTTEARESTLKRRTTTSLEKAKQWQPPIPTPSSSSFIAPASSSNAESSNYRKRKPMDTFTPSQENTANGPAFVDPTSSFTQTKKVKSPTDKNSTPSQGYTTQSEDSLISPHFTTPKKNKAAELPITLSKTAPVVPIRIHGLSSGETTEGSTLSGGKAPITPHPSSPQNPKTPSQGYTTQSEDSPIAAHSPTLKKSNTVNHPLTPDKTSPNVPRHGFSSGETTEYSTSNDPITPRPSSPHDPKTPKPKQPHIPPSSGSPTETCSSCPHTNKSHHSSPITPFPSSFPQQLNYNEHECPLTNADVFLPTTFMKFPKLFELLSHHDVYMIHELRLPPGIPDLRGNIGRRKIVIVDTRRNGLTKRIVGQCVNWGRLRRSGDKSKRKEKVEVYDWRVCEETRKRAGVGMWDLWKVWEV